MKLLKYCKDRVVVLQPEITEAATAPAAASVAAAEVIVAADSPPDDDKEVEDMTNLLAAETKDGKPLDNKHIISMRLILALSLPFNQKLEILKLFKNHLNIEPAPPKVEPKEEKKEPEKIKTPP